MIKDSAPIPPEDRELFQEAWHTARAWHGNDFTFYLPGMVRYGNQRGRYPAISITGDECRMMCEHCRGRLLQPMIKVTGPDELIEKCRRLSDKGSRGVLLSGGSDREGRLPWENFCDAIQKIKTETGLLISAHTGFPGPKTSLALKEAGVDQALIDVMGDRDTASRVYHLDRFERVVEALDGISESGLELVPHLVAGRVYGAIHSEYRALEILKHYRPSALVIVVLNPLKGTPMARVSPPSPLEVARLIAFARLTMPKVPISLGCERPRNKETPVLERLAILAGVNRMAVWSEEAIEEAQNLGLRPRFQPTCCSVDSSKA
ncbi:MAG: radical SAM protein [Desulfobacterales bacterium]|nr:radical SAM protein [Desulfobacterales bacterium]